MAIIERKTGNGGHEYKFDNGEWVCLWPEDESWEYQKDPDDEETYMSGGYELDGNVRVFEYTMPAAEDIPLKNIL